MEVIELGSDAIEVADAVVVAVCEAAGINFVEYGVLPPLASMGIGLLPGARGCGGEARAKNKYGSDCNFLKQHTNPSVFSYKNASNQYQHHLIDGLNHVYAIFHDGALPRNE